MNIELIKKLRKIGADIRILYVEDDKAIQEQLEHLLQKIFRHVDKANNGKEGLDLYETHKYDIIISDIKMPVMDGIEMAEAIKTMDEHQTIVFTSAYNDSEYLAKIINIGVDKFILKPIDLTQFFKTISKLVVSHYNERRHKHLETSLLESAEENQMILDNLPSPIVLFEKGVPLSINKAFIEVFGDLKHLQEEDRLLSESFEDAKFFTFSNNELIETLLAHNKQHCVIKSFKNEKMHTYCVVATELSPKKQMLSFFNVDDLSLKLNSLAQEVSIDQLTGFTLRRFFIKDLEAIVKGEKEPILVIFEINHMPDFITKFGVASTPDIYARLGTCIREEFEKSIQNNDINVSKFGTNKFVLLCERKELEQVKGKLEQFYKNYSYSNSLNYMKEPLHIDYLTLEVKKDTKVDFILDEIENRFYMLK